MLAGLKTRRVLLVAAAVVILLSMVTVRLTAGVRLEHWTSSCQARGGMVETLTPGADNPLVAESDDPTYRCVTADGRVLSRWR